ncbi:MAG: PKD repeat protein, partial [Salibacteraceae bacterium]
GASKSILSNVDGTIGASFTWSGYSGDSTNQDPGATVSDFELPSKRAYVKVTVDHKGCISQDSILMKILGRPVVTITDTVNGLLFKVTSNTSAGSTHSWDFGDGDSSNFRLPKHIYKTDGIYTVTYTNSNQCRSTSESFEVTVITLNILENTSGATLTLYPNPNNGLFNLDFKGLSANDISVSIMDINGRTVYNEAYGILNGNSNKAVNLVDVATGFYTISVEVDGETYQEKFIVK